MPNSPRQRAALLALSPLPRLPLQLALLLAFLTLGCERADQADPVASGDKTVASSASATDSQAEPQVKAEFIDQPLTDSDAEKLAAAASTLKQLTVRQADLTSSGWSAVAQCKAIEQLDLRECNITDEQLGTLLSAMPKLKALRLNGKNGQTQVTDVGLQALANCPNLKVLAIDFLPIGHTTVAAIQSCQELAEFLAAGTQVDDQCLSILAAMPKLRTVRLSQTGITNSGVDQLSDCELTSLDLSECEAVSDAVGSSLGKMASLEKLNLYSTQVGNETARELSGLTTLKWLNLDATQINDEALVDIAKLSALEFLHLGSTAITDAALPALSALTQLRDLIVTRTEVTAEGVALLQPKLPQTKIQLEYIPGK